MIHPHTEVRFIGPEIGYGVVATAFIPRGTITWVKDQLDREFSPQDLERFDESHREILDRYSYRNSLGHYVFCWDHTRFMNHSFSPACLPAPYGLEIAVRDIAAGEEMTNDYGCFNIIEAFTPLDEGHERKEVRPDDLLRFSAAWDALIAEALRGFLEVNQPLARLVPPHTWSELRSVARGAALPRSVATLYYRPEAAPSSRL